MSILSKEISGGTAKEMATEEGELAPSETMDTQNDEVLTKVVEASIEDNVTASAADEDTPIVAAEATEAATTAELPPESNVIEGSDDSETIDVSGGDSSNIVNAKGGDDIINIGMPQDDTLPDVESLPKKEPTISTEPIF